MPSRAPVCCPRAHMLVQPNANTGCFAVIKISCVWNQLRHELCRLDCSKRKLSPISFLGKKPRQGDVRIDGLTFS
jgi:hypothetical protein